MEQNKALYRKYRPNNFGDIAGHQNVVEILKSELKNNKISHSFLFAGQRGTGKTSIARILAKSVNCKNLSEGVACENCESCFASNEQRNPDIIEMDAASNNGVDEIREIKNNINSLPFLGKYKIYIIDEVHMLTKAAFNALLKTLEEPPTHAIFILATTEYAKIPPTILSRCQIFNFKKIDRNSLINRMHFICKNEGYSIDRPVLDEVGIISEGSLRDALNIIEQLMTVTTDHITIEDLKSVFYVATKNEKKSILINILNNNAQSIIEYFETANNQGMDFDVFTLSLIEIVKEIIEYKLTGNQEILNTLEVNDVNDFTNAEMKALFEIADNLSEAYAKTKGTNINFNYLLISVLKSLNHQTKEVSAHPILENIEHSSPITVSEQVKQKVSEEIKVEVKDKEQMFETAQTVIQDQNNSEISEELKVVEAVELNIKETVKIEKAEIIETIKEPIDTLTSLKIELSKNLVDNEDKKTYKIQLDEIINLLVGANKAKREEIEKSFNRIFEVDNQGNLLNSKEATNFIDFYNFKILAASNNEVLIRAEDFENVNNLIFKLQNEEFRKNVENQFGKIIFLPIDEIFWNEVKIQFKRLKENNQLPTYAQMNYDSYFDNKKQSVVFSHLDEKTIEVASKLFGIDDIEIED
ncbi:DNA polymerase III, subunit gamma and tau [Mesoplasma chauliocola]|uniref:DNA polymerase III subunit gamma/tau n=1 Tax=Mesoplasma chauliocola TaxID=216427 RepID=A0A249SPA1_9MOLU|nr:DNA polymerase III subunit gamma/tau [Mesoplasma chauliocola]ASZ09450.1 DNA polymerase III, subunit gamma and tau [Mesoplasma chauliocola]